MTKQKLRKTFLYSVYLLLVVFIALEIFLRIYNPFHFRLKYNKIILPANQQYVIKNNINPKLDKSIRNTRNALGFRGPDKPADWDQYLSIITVGGSTTECHFLSDDKTWPYLLEKNLKSNFRNIWLNNAGFDGHSTFGHQVLLNDYLINLQPKVILFLIGINDVENSQPSFHDKLNTKGAYPDLKHFIFTNSEVLSLALNIGRGLKAQKHNNTTHEQLDLTHYSTLHLPDSAINARLRKQAAYLKNYRTRVQQLIDTCKAHSIHPVFITQPLLLGVGKDSITGADLENYKIAEDRNGRMEWALLELYNKNTTDVCIASNIDFIDLAQMLPKNSVYFYDQSHYTNAGAQKVAEILSDKLNIVLAERFPTFKNKR